MEYHAGNNDIQRNSHRKYFLPRVDIKVYNVLIDGRNFYANLLMMKSESMMKLEKLHWEEEMTTQQVVCLIINILKTTIS